MDIFLLVVGLLLLIKGGIKIGSRELSKKRARTVGVVAVLPFLFSFMMGFVASLRGIEFRQLIPENTSLIINVVVLAILIAVPLLSFKKVGTVNNAQPQ